MESVILSPYIITVPSTFLAALPTVCINEVSDRRKPSLSASNMATKDTSGISKPSLRRFIPTNTSNSPNLKLLIIFVLSIVSISECRYLTFIPTSFIYSVKSSAIFFVRVVTSTLCCFFTLSFTSPIKLSICPFTGFICISGSISPVGLIICSTTWLLLCSSYCAGVALTQIT